MSTDADVPTREEVIALMRARPENAELAAAADRDTAAVLAAIDAYEAKWGGARPLPLVADPFTGEMRHPRDVALAGVERTNDHLVRRWVAERTGVWGQA